MHKSDLIIDWRDGLCYAYYKILPYVQSVGTSPEEAETVLTSWYENNHPSIYFGLPVSEFWWIFIDDPYHVFIAEHKYDELYDSVFDKFQEIFGDPPQQVSAWSPEIITVFPLEKLRSLQGQNP